METQVYSTWLEIDLDAIRNNVRAVERRTNTNVMAVIKANGYGHGALQVARAATEAGATWCGVARMEEALTLREQGITSELMV
ncbi:MAG: alanine racemase, partial [Anaerolineaceae bacterium]|nr:alanine racemase [Anaerolineaceae bacterium]